MVAPIDRSASPWIELIKLLVQGRNDMESIYQGRSSPSPRYVDRVAFLRSEEAPLGSQIERALASWLDTGKWPTLSFEAKYYANLRFAAAVLLLTRVVIGLDTNEPTTIFPFPPLERKAVANWLLVDWWEACGRELLCSLGDPHQPAGE